MIEGTPEKPYKHSIADIGLVECNMKKRRELLQSKLKSDEIILMMTCFPRLGCPNFTTPSYEAGCEKDSKGNPALSLFFPNEAVTQGHPRFITLARNIKARRGEKVCINVPVFKDENTSCPFIDPTVPENTERIQDDYIYMDAMGFGMGCCCLQVTFQASSVDEARMLYDYLCPLTPILMALSAASPVWKGFMSDIDCRWEVIASSVDDRNAYERGESDEPVNKDSPNFRIETSRYSTLDSYLSKYGAKYNDMAIVKNEQFHSKLKEAGVDDLLSQHIAHLFIRQPVVVFKNILDYTSNDTFHFETIQSTNWNNMRFKVPPPNSDIGWRVEFRTPELQFTEFENAALVTFILLITRVILSYRPHLLIPVSMIKENMRRAQLRDAVLTQKFFFGTNIMRKNEEKKCGGEPDEQVDYSSIQELSIDEIVNGCNIFVGLVPLIKKYIDTIDIDPATCCKIGCYLHFLSCRASGKLITNAKWIRNFVAKHPDYKKDSVVTDKITYDMLCRMRDVFNIPNDPGSDLLRNIIHEYSN